MKKFKTKILGTFALILSGAAVPAAHAEEYKISIGAYVPVECEFSVSNSFVRLSAGQFRIATINQFCNTGYEMSISHAALNGSASARFRNDVARVGAGSTLLQNNGRPVNSAADLFLEANSDEDAVMFAQTLAVQVTPTGL